MNESFTFEATLKTTSSQQIFIKAIQNLSQVNKEINILLTPQCLVLSTRNTNFSSALRVEFGRQFFDEWHYKPYLLEHGLEGRSDKWRNYNAEMTEKKGNNSKKNVSGDLYSFKISALGVLLKNFAFEKGYSMLVNKNEEDNDENEDDPEMSNFVDMDNNSISNKTSNKFVNKFFEASRDTADLINESEKDVISSIKLILDNTASCPSSRINKLKITTRSNRGDKLIKTYMPYIIPCFFENYVIEKRYKCRFGNQYLPQLQNMNNEGFLAIFRDLVSLYGIDRLDVDLDKLNLSQRVYNTLKNADEDQIKAKVLIPDKEVFEDFENDGIDYSTEDTNLYVNYLKSKLSIWKDITDNINGTNIENLNMKIDTKQLTMRSLTKTINLFNDTLSMDNLNSTGNKTNAAGSIDKVTSNFLRDGMSVSNSVPAVQLNNTCLAIGMDHEVTFKFKDFKNFLNLIFSASNTQKVQMVTLLNFLKNEEYKEGKTGLTSKLNSISDELLNFWFADNPGAPIMLEYAMPTVWKSDKIENNKLSNIVNSVKFKLFLLTDYREAQEKLLKQAIEAKERLEENNVNNDDYGNENNKKEKLHPLIKLSMERREQRKTQSPQKMSEEREKGKHLFLDLDEEEINRFSEENQEEAYNGDNQNDIFDDNVEFVNESQYHYPSVNNNPIDEIEFLDQGNVENEFVDQEGNSYNYDAEELLSKLEKEKQNAQGESLLKGFNKFQSRKRQFNELENSHGEDNALDINNDAEVDQLGEVSFSASLDKQQFKGIFDEADNSEIEKTDEVEGTEKNALNNFRNKSTSMDSEPPVIHYGKKHKGPVSYTEEELSLGATQTLSNKVVINKGLLD